MDGAENKPMIRIHLDQQVTIDAVSGHEEVEDATVITEITGFDVEDDLYVLRGALSFSGFLRMEDTSDTGNELPDAFDDRDVFATDEEMPEAPVMPFHHSLPFVLQVPVAAQQAHQRESGVLNVNPKIGQWNVHVLGEHTVHLRAELVIQGLSGQDGYVFRCGSQEEGAVASKLDQLLDQEESRSFIPPAPQLEEEVFEPPFEPAWQVEEGANMRQGFEGVESEEAPEDDWLIESPVQETDEVELRDQEDEETEIVFTPDPEIVFPMPDPDSDWGRQLAASDRAFIGHAPHTAPYAGAKEFARAYDPQQDFGVEPAPEFAPHVFANEREEAEQAIQETEDAEAFVLEPVEEVEVERQLAAYEFAPEPAVNEAFSPDRFAKEDFSPERFANEVFAREGFGQEQFQQQVTASEQQQPAFTREAVEEHQPVFSKEAREEHQPVFSMEAREEQQPVFTREAHEEQQFVFTREAHEEQPVFAAEEREEQPHFDAEDERTELGASEQADAEHAADDVMEASAPAAHATEFEAEYHFEDELPAEEIHAVPASSPLVEAVEHPLIKSTGPKLSVSGKGVTMETDEPIKLSALLGDSRAQAVEALAESVYVESGPLTESAQLIRESLSYTASSSHSAHASSEPSAPVYTSDQGHSSDSIWGDLLFGGRETKTTMKFRVVQEDESLPDLAEQYNTPLGELLRANNLNQNHVDPGQILYIPTRRR